jgi:hypothetical protein
VTLITPTAQRRRRSRGATTGELLIYMVVAALLVSAIYRMLIRQGRGYAQQLAAIDVDESARAAANGIAWDLRHAGVAGHQLVSPLSSDSIGLIALQGVGVVCQRHNTLPRYAIWKMGGSIEATADDSAAVYRASAGVWKSVKVGSVNSGSLYGMTSCAWSGGRLPDLVAEFAVGTPEDTLGIGIGSPVRVFRHETYKAITESGRTWLARRVGTGPYEKLTGPLNAVDGLAFSYHDASGSVTTNPADVRMVRFTIRAQSSSSYRNAAGAFVYRTDSVTTAVAVRR